MPKEPWTGYKRFCPLAKGLDLVGERWTLVIVQELFKSPELRFSELERRLPGIGTSVLAGRLRKLEIAGVIERRAGRVGETVVYVLTELGRRLGPALEAFRQWGVEHLVAGVPDQPPYDLSFVEGIETLPSEEYEWHVDDSVTTFRFRDGELVQGAGPSKRPAIVLRTTSKFMKRWAAGRTDWDRGRRDGEVLVEGPNDAWRRMLAATGYLRAVDAGETA